MVKPELKSSLLIPNPEVLYTSLIFLGLDEFLSLRKEGKKDG